MLAAPATTAIPATSLFDMGAGAWSLAPIADAVAGVRVPRSWLVASAGSAGASGVVWTTPGTVALRVERVGELDGALPVH